MLSEATRTGPIFLPVFCMPFVRTTFLHDNYIYGTPYLTRYSHIGTFYCLTLAICVLYAGIRLMRLLDLHLQMLGSGKRYELVKTGRMKVRKEI